MKKAFTITELLVAMGLMAVVLAASGLIFNYSVDAQRTASATSEIMRNLRAITDQLNADFEGLSKEGYLVLRSQEIDGNNVDNIYYFSTGDFQSWFDSDIRSNIARIYFGHDNSSYNTLPGNLARDVVLLTPGISSSDLDDCLDCNAVSYAQCLSSIETLEKPEDVLNDHQPVIDINDSNDIHKLLCQNVGSLKIEWTYGRYASPDPNIIAWWGLDNTIRNEDPNTADIIGEKDGPPYIVFLRPGYEDYYPYALKFTFTLYDSKGIIKGGRTFTHIVYIGK